MKILPFDELAIIQFWLPLCFVVFILTLLGMIAEGLRWYFFVKRPKTKLQQTVRSIVDGRR